MELSRAFIITLKIIAVDIIFLAIMLVLFVSNNIVLELVGSLILLILILAVAIYFILKEVEDMINVSLSSKQMEEEFAREQTKSNEKALTWIKSDIDETKFQPMIDKMIEKNQKRGSLNPETLLQSQIKEKIAQGKTKEQAIEELYEANKSKPRAKKERASSEQKETSSEQKETSSEQKQTSPEQMQASPEQEQASSEQKTTEQKVD